MKSPPGDSARRQSTVLQLDVPALIRSFVGLSMRLWEGNAARGSSGRLIAVDPWTLRFKNTQLELVYVSSCLCNWGDGASFSPHWLLSELAYISLLFVATFIVPTPVTGQSDPLFALRESIFFVSFSCLIILDVAFWIVYRLLRPWRERALASTKHDNWLPLATYMLATNYVVPFMIVTQSLVSAICESVALQSSVSKDFGKFLFLNLFM
jgi:hypothetical protein